MLPESKNNPVIFAQSFGNFFIPSNVPFDLLFPEGCVRLWCRTVIRTGVPEAAVNEDDDATASENKIGTPDQPARRSDRSGDVSRPLICDMQRLRCSGVMTSIVLPR